MTRAAVWVPLFDELADPRVAVDLAVAAEEAGWDGFFVWDHIRWREPVAAAGDPWITLAAIASATERIRLGTLVTAVARRRPAPTSRPWAAAGATWCVTDTEAEGLTLDTVRGFIADGPAR